MVEHKKIGRRDIITENIMKEAQNDIDFIPSIRKKSFNNLEFKIEGVPIRRTVQLRIVPGQESGLAEIRFWHENHPVGIQKVKNEDLNLVRF